MGRGEWNRTAKFQVGEVVRFRRPGTGPTILCEVKRVELHPNGKYRYTLKRQGDPDRGAKVFTQVEERHVRKA